MHYHDTMKTIAIAYLSNQECFVKEAMCHVLPELMLRRIFSVVYFVNVNPPEERVQVLLSVKEISQLLGESPNIFKKSDINCCMEKPCATFRNGEYSVLNNFLYTKFLPYCTLDTRKDL